MNIKRSLLYTVPVLASFAALTAAVWGRGKAALAEEYERIADEYIGVTVNSCSRCARELSDAVDELNVSLSKLRVIASREGRVLALEDIVRESAEAAILLSRLPGSQVGTMELNAFLTRAGDYARTLSKKLLEGGELEKADIDQLTAMLDGCEKLNGSLCCRIASGEMPLGTEEFDYYGGEETADEPSEPEYPVLIYDGPFSEATEKLEPAGLTGAEADEKAAAEHAETLFGEGFGYDGRAEGRIATYEFSDGEASLSLTVKGLHVIRYMRQPKGEAEGLPEAGEDERLRAAAKAFLERLGYTSMAPTYAQYYGGTALYSFVWESGGALVYNDLVKVWIDRETMEPCGLDARNYLFSHKERDIGAPSISAERARESVSEELEVASVRLALIPLTPQTEALCYEFVGTLGGADYVVYVNASDGREEQVFIVISDENGQSTV